MWGSAEDGGTPTLLRGSWAAQSNRSPLSPTLQAGGPDPGVGRAGSLGG